VPQFKAHNLWPIPVYESEAPVKSEWLDYILNTEYERMHIGNGDISKDRYILNNLPELKNVLENHCNNFVRKYLNVSENAKFYLQNSWSVKHNPGDIAQIHSHGSSLLSGVYYLKTNEGSGNLVFHKNPIYTNTFHQSIRFEYDENNNLNTGQYAMNVEDGKVILFPSHLEHSVDENKSNEERYSLAFNFYVRGTFGKEEYILEIK
tara:strand:- start:850 stop:1467 length:618 start_codon:yes stop_codon:yes gene_type:complete